MVARTYQSALAPEQPLRERRRLCEQDPRAGTRSPSPGHALELLDGRDHVEDGEASDEVRVVERHAVGDARAAVVAGDGEPLVPDAPHQLDELGRDLARGVALAERPALRRRGSHRSP